MTDEPTVIFCYLTAHKSRKNRHIMGTLFSIVVQVIIFYVQAIFQHLRTASKAGSSLCSGNSWCGTINIQLPSCGLPQGESPSLCSPGALITLVNGFQSLFLQSHFCQCLPPPSSFLSGSPVTAGILAQQVQVEFGEQIYKDSLSTTYKVNFGPQFQSGKRKR